MISASFERDPFPGKPKVLFIGLSESSHTHSWVDLLEGSPFNVRLFALPSSAPPNSWKVKTYVTAYDCPAPDTETRTSMFNGGHMGRLVSRSLARATGRSREVWDPAAKWLAKNIRRWRPDVIHTLGLDQAAYFYVKARKQYHLQDAGKWVAQVRGGPELSLLRLLPEHAAQIREVLEECDQLIADNQQIYEYALDLGLRAECVSPLGVVPGAGGVDVVRSASSWDGPPSRRRMILYPKAYECPASKALPVFEAIKVAWDRIRPCEIHMLSATPETRMWFQTLPQEIRRSCHIDVRIARARVIEMMTRARVMLAPTLSDGVPNSLYEAMAAGAFPIVSPLDTISAVVEEERNVLFARNLYPEEIAGALVRAMTDDTLVDAAAQENLALVRRVANRDEVRARVIDFYENLAGRVDSGTGR